MVVQLVDWMEYMKAEKMAVPLEMQLAAWKVARMVAAKVGLKVGRLEQQWVANLAAKKAGNWGRMMAAKMVQLTENCWVGLWVDSLVQ